MKKMSLVAISLFLSTAMFAAQDAASGVKAVGVGAGKTGKAVSKGGFAVVKNVVKDGVGLVKHEVGDVFHGAKKVGGQLKRSVKA